MNSIYSTVSSIWNRVKSIFSAVLRPNIKMPKISISGKFSLNPPSVPKFGKKKCRLAMRIVMNKFRNKARNPKSYFKIWQLEPKASFKRLVRGNA